MESYLGQVRLVGSEVENTVRRSEAIWGLVYSGKGLVLVVRCPAGLSRTILLGGFHPSPSSMSPPQSV